MSLASSTGLVSGLDYSSIISKLRQAGSGPITLAQRAQSKIQNQSSALDGIQKVLTDFKAKAEALNSESSFLSMTASPSDYTVLNASTTGTSSVEGNYSIQVKQLAQTHRIASQGVATTNSTPIANGSGKFNFKVGSGTEISVDVTSGMTLQELADKINNAEGTKVRASIVSDGTPTKPYRLVLTSNESGQDNAIKITKNDTLLNLSTSTIEDAVASSSNAFNGTMTTSGTYTGKTGRNVVIQMTSAGDIGTAKYKVSLDGGVTWSADNAFTTSDQEVDVTGATGEGIKVKFAPNASPTGFAVGDTFTIDAFVPELQKAQNAIVSVDGVQISRPTNTFSDVIEGVSFTAKKVSSETQSIKVENSSSGVVNKIKEFATAYNSLVDTIAKSTAYDTKNKSAAVLFGDSGVMGIQSKLRSILTSSVPGAKNYGTLSSIGITMDGSGHMNVDTTKVSDALKKDMSAVKALFVESGKTSSSAIQFVKSGSATKVGNYNVEITTAATQAAVTGTRALEDTGLADGETLTVTYNETSIAINLAAGSKIDSIVDTLNTQFRNKSMAVQAVNEGGKLRIASTNYGSDYTVSVFSNKAADAAGQLGLGNAVQSNTGVDVAGKINGVAATGSGQTLKGAKSTDVEGLELKITALVPMTGSVALTHGVALSTTQSIDGMTDSETGLFATRKTSYDARIKEYDKQIDSLTTRLDAEEARLRKQFTDLETKLSQLQSQGSSLQAQLASLAG